jgi:hypothetical protein
MATSSGVTDPAANATRALQVVGESRKRVLDPVDRFSEIIFGLIMVLAFTCSLSVAASGRQGARDMLVAALSCSLAWGLVDGVMYVLTSIVERARRGVVLRGLLAANGADARKIVLEALPEGTAEVVDDATADRMVERIRALPTARQASVNMDDVWGAVASCLLVVLATLPPTIPFLLVADAATALRMSNGLAVASLFLAGYSLGRATGLRGWLIGLAMVVLGFALVALTIALGG